MEIHVWQTWTTEKLMEGLARLEVIRQELRRQEAKKHQIWYGLLVLIFFFGCLLAYGGRIWVSLGITLLLSLAFWQGAQEAANQVTVVEKFRELAVRAGLPPEGHTGELVISDAGICLEENLKQWQWSDFQRMVEISGWLCFQLTGKKGWLYFEKDALGDEDTVWQLKEHCQARGLALLYLEPVLARDRAEKKRLEKQMRREGRWRRRGVMFAAVGLAVGCILLEAVL